MAPAAALGELEWEQHGGTVVRCIHPSGRISFTYVSPRGEKFRSWKQCQNFMEADRVGSFPSPGEDAKKLVNPRKLQQNGKNPSGAATRVLVSDDSSTRGDEDYNPFTTPRARLVKTIGSLYKPGPRPMLQDSSEEDTTEANPSDEDYDPHHEPRLKASKSKDEDYNPCHESRLKAPKSKDAQRRPSVRHYYSSPQAGLRQRLQEPTEENKVVSPSTFSPRAFVAANMAGRPAFSKGPVARPVSDMVPVELSSDDEDESMEAHIFAPNRNKDKKAKKSHKLTEPRKRSLTESGRRRIEESRRAAATANAKRPGLANSDAAKKPECTRREFRTYEAFVGDSTPDDDDDLHSGKPNGQSKYGTDPSAMPPPPSKVQDSGRKRVHELSYALVVSHKKNKTDEFENFSGREDNNHKNSSSGPRRAAARANFKVRGIKLKEKNALVDFKGLRTVDGEDVAVVLTSEPGEDQPPQRKILDFFLRDTEGVLRSVEYLDSHNLYITAVVFSNKSLDTEKAVRCEGFGPITSWSIIGYEKKSSNPRLVFCTDVAEYYCETPAGNYKKVYDPLFEKAKVCVEVYRNLSKPDGGDPHLHFDELVARVSRSFGKQGDYGDFFNREFILTHWEFVVSQLTALDRYAEEKDQLFTGLPALVSLEQEGQKRSSTDHPIGDDPRKILEDCPDANGDASIGADPLSDSMQEDESLPHLLQEEDDRVRGNPARKTASSRRKYYVKINEAEIANDYPLPAYYKAEDEEIGEHILFDDMAVEDPEDLPARKLHDWTLYNADSRLISLELLPMLHGAENDMEIFGSGIITEDDGAGFCLDSDTTDGSNGGAVSIQKGNCELGVRVYLRAIKEWKIEFRASMLFISLRTDGAWYRLGKPSRLYVGWYQPVLKTARIAVKINTLLEHEPRGNPLSLNDVIKKLADQRKDEPAYISSRVSEVERYVVVHGQIILQQLAGHPDEMIKSAFITNLAANMEELSHTKLTLSQDTFLVNRGGNSNPLANLCLDGNKSKPMRSTMTRLVDHIWNTYYNSSGEADETITKISENDVEVLEEELADDSDEEDKALFETKSFSRDTPKKKSKFWKASGSAVQWVDVPVGKTSNNELVYRSAKVHGEEITAGKSVLVYLDEGSDQVDRSPVILLIEYLYNTRRDGPMLHGRVLLRGRDTILGDAANEREIFLTDGCEDVEIEKTIGFVAVEMRERKWGHAFRKENYEKDEDDRASAIDRDKKGLPIEYFCRSWYSPERGAFFSLPLQTLALGMGTCKACEARRETEEKLEVQIFPKGGGFRFQGIEYHIGDYCYLDPDTFDSETDISPPNVLFKGSRNKGLRAFAVCELLTVLQSQNKNVKMACRLMKVRRFYRPEDIDQLKAYKADIHEVYYSEETSIVDIATVRGKCVVRRQVHEVAVSEECAVNHVFFCNCIHDPKTGTVKQLPTSVKLSTGSSLLEATGKSQAEEIAAKAKAKGKAAENDPAWDRASELALSTLDIFAGCGGLSEGLRQSGVAITKWAIESDFQASEAFKLNHPSAAVFCDNCNVILRSIMEIGGDQEDCVSTPEVHEQSLKLEEARKCKLPKPGEVDFISGGPPCQGFSGMNRFNQRAWSKVQFEMILSYLSYADYFRPRFFLLENVRTFVSFNKGQTFRLSLASLLEMGYQVRFGILQAGHYGVCQSRKRAFIWAAAPGDVLPEWPEPRHVFSSSQLGVALPGGFHYAAVRDAGRGAPLRAITVRDTIGDLPPVENGANKEEQTYISQPESWFQAQIRGEETIIRDHIAKEMNEINLIRCQRIPREPGADWRTLPEEKVRLSTEQIVDLIPWCLPNTAERRKQWKGLFGRLDWDGNFPSSMTNPQCMGKVGMCFHPEQDRIITVRECARAQGFPDVYKFFGPINSKHWQIGNAVPPPLARALGHTLKEAIKARRNT